MVNAKTTLLEIYALLYHLGLTANYKGFFHLSRALELCVLQPERLQFITKQVYRDVARQFSTTWTAVERNIRTAVGLIWQTHRPQLEALAGRPLHRKPTNTKLLAILVHSLSSDRTQSDGDPQSA